MNVARVLDKRVDYIMEAFHINPLRHSYTTIKRFTACLQMFSPLFCAWHDSDPVPSMWLVMEIARLHLAEECLKDIEHSKHTNRSWK